MLRYVTIRPDLHLVAQHVPLPVQSVQQHPLHHILLLDRSGSMHWTISQLIDNVTERILSLPVGDYVSVGYFSGEGEYRFVLKGFCIVKTMDDLQDITIRKVLDELRHTLNTTCFSEILAESDIVLRELKALTPLVTLTLFTDGCPVVSNLQREHAAIRQALDELAPRLTSALLVGYGSYYNKQLMAEMAERLGGTLAHADTIPTFAVSLEQFIDTSRSAGSRLEVQLPMAVTLGNAFSVSGKHVTLYQLDDRDMLYFSPQYDVKNYVYFLSASIPDGAQHDIFDPLATVQTPQSPLVAGAYACALMLVQQGKTSDALDVLGVLGDVALIDAVNNAFTVPEFGAAEQRIQVAMYEPAQRFTKGRQLAYVPKADAFCVLDALDVLMSDTTARFYPSHPDFVYQRIGRRRVTDPGYPRFEADTAHGVPFDDLVWNQRFLNLSVRFRIPGTVQLGDEAALLGFENPYPTHRWRNYTIIKDGMLNTKHLPVTCSAATFKTLFANGVASGMTEHDGAVRGIATLHLEHLPVMNRAIATGYRSATALCKDVMEELRLMAILKVLRAKRDELDEAQEAAGMTDAQAEYLAQYGIGKHGYAPPSTEEKATDFYLSKTFSISARGFSSLPSIKSVLEKMKTNAKRTPSDALIVAGVDHAERIAPLGSPASQKIETWVDAIRIYSAKLAMIRSNIQRTKFSVLLGKGWFEEFPTPADATIVVDGVQFTFEVRDNVKVEV